MARFPQTDLKTLKLKLNQKCQDKTRAAGHMRRNIRALMDDPQTNDDGTGSSFIINESIWLTIGILQVCYTV